MEEKILQTKKNGMVMLLLTLPVSYTHLDVYKRQGKEYDSLELSGMEKMTVQDLIDTQKSIGNETAAMYAMEMTTSFAQEMAVKATGKPPGQT